MFDKNFFPTPKELVVKMLEPYYLNGQYSFRNKTILEPSAGKGDIIDEINNSMYNNTVGIYAIEKSFELQAILKDKKIKVVHDDFLTYKSDFNFDYIIMNPPFDNGAKHLLKAWEIAENTDIICLLNAETIKNPHTKERQLLIQIIEDNNGSVEYIENAFTIAERKTGVEVALVRLTKTTEESKYHFDNMQFENIEFSAEEFEEKSVAIDDKVGNIIIMYENIKQDYLEMTKYKNRIKKYAKNIVTKYGKILGDYINSEDTSEKEYKEFIIELKKEVWKFIFDKLDIERFMTSEVQRKFSNYLEENNGLAITKKNIYNFVNVIIQTRGQNLEECIVEVFDVFTRYDKDNRIHVEGWKTNDAWKTNKRIVLPRMIKRWNEYNFSEDKFGIDWSNNSKLLDIDKAMSYISGKNYKQIRTIADALEYRFDKIGSIRKGQIFDNDVESEFFYIKFYKKGTIHLKFKDDFLWEQFNKRAVKQKFGLVLPN